MVVITTHTYSTPFRVSEGLHFTFIVHILRCNHLQQSKYYHYNFIGQGLVDGDRAIGQGLVDGRARARARVRARAKVLPWPPETDHEMRQWTDIPD